MIKVIVDCFGGDHSPEINVSGAIRALNENKDLYLILTGDHDKINRELKQYTFDHKRLEIVHAPDVISGSQKPTEAIKRNKESSLVKGFDLLKANDDINAMVTVGSTGAVLVGSVLKTGRIPGISRPVFCPLLPTMKQTVVGICDGGANTDCTAQQLVQFAVMGSLYLEKVYQIKRPKTALLNIGTEEGKGNTLTKETYNLLKANKAINFIGNMESRDLLSGDYDLIVCDGFAGNVLLKATEGACNELLKLLKKTLKHGLKNKIGALLLKKDLYKIKDRTDYNNYGGAVMLGTGKTIIKGHGSSKDTAVYHCIRQAYDIEKSGLRAAIEEEIKKTV